MRICQSSTDLEHDVENLLDNFVKTIWSLGMSIKTILSFKDLKLDGIKSVLTLN